MPSGDSKCKYCHEPIRWVDDDGKRLALDLVPTPKGSYCVAGADTARKIAKAKRSTFGRLYRPHKETCAKWDDVKAMLQRQAIDRADSKHRPPLPENVVLMRDRRR